MRVRIGGLVPAWKSSVFMRYSDGAFVDANGSFTEHFAKALPDMLGDAYYNDPETKQQPTKMFENVKDLKTMAVNYANSQRAISKKTEGMIKLPGENAAAEEVAAYRKAIGVPDNPQDYKLGVPDGDDKAGFEAISQIVAKAGVEANIPAAAMSKIWDSVTGELAKQTAALEKAGLDMMQAEEEALKAELGTKYDSFVQSGDAALAKFKGGQDAAKLFESMGIKGHPAVRKLLAEIAPLVLESKTVIGDAASGDAAGKWPISYKYDQASGRPVE